MTNKFKEDLIGSRIPLLVMFAFDFLFYFIQATWLLKEKLGSHTFTGISHIFLLRIYIEVQNVSFFNRLEGLSQYVFGKDEEQRCSPTINYDLYSKCTICLGLAPLLSLFTLKMSNIWNVLLRKCEIASLPLLAIN